MREGQPSRRLILLSGLAATLLNAASSAQDVLPSAPLATDPQPQPAKPRQLSIAQQLEHVVVLLRTVDDKGQQFSGTGFFFNFFVHENKALTAIVTNKHVVAGMKNISVKFTKRNTAGEPDYGNLLEVTLDGLEGRTIFHPDAEVDLAIIAISDVLNKYEAESQPPYTLGVTQDLIADENGLKNFQPLEEILVVGYPDGLSDSVNNIPIFRRGVTATPVYMRFEGRKQFMIDASIYHGSSGSPVFLYNVGAWLNEKGEAQLGSRVGLLGVVWGVFEKPTEGDIKLVPAPTQFQPKAFSQIPHNLGACVPAYCLLDFESEIIKRGYQPPEGYKLRVKS